MPTIITHGLVALALAAKTRFGGWNRQALLVAAAICSMVPDLDYIGFKLNVQYSSLFGHRGFTHSFFFAALVAAVAAWLLGRKKERARAEWAKVFLLLFAVTASHGLLDAFTDGGEGVAFFSPFSNHRYFFPWRPIMVAPLGVEGFFNLRGMVVLLDEFLLVLLPLAMVLFWREIWSWGRIWKATSVVLVLAWLVAIWVIQNLYPLNNLAMLIPSHGRPLVDLYTKQYGDPEILKKIPADGIPGGKLVVNFDDFQRRGMFNQRLETAGLKDHWASGFWANWFGGVAGRWQDPTVALLLRTLFGYGVPDAQEILEVLKASAENPAKRDFLFRLSPAEKYDLAVGDYAFSATRSVLSLTHNRDELPKFWYGICNGMATAAKLYEEPYRAVDVINPNGFKIRFHPNDVKALMGYAHAEVSAWSQLGNPCTINGPEAEGCRINAGALFLATMNRIGLAHDSFIVDGFSGVRKQFYLFDAARVEVLQSPRPVPEGWAMPTQVKSLAQVRFHMEFVTTLLSDKAGGQPDEARGEGYFKKVGRITVPRQLDAVLALDQKGDVVGGAWLRGGDVPDMVYFPSALPATVKGERLQMNTAFHWPTIQSIYFKSVTTAKVPAPVDLSF